MDRFERDRALAPGARLRFELLPRLPNTQLDGISLRVVGDNAGWPVQMAPDHTFILERNPQALREDAALIASSKTSTLTWRAQVRSPNLAPGTRRLGDLRLECLVGITAGLVSNNSALFAWLGDWLSSPERVCSAPDGNYLFFAERPLFGVTLHDGARSEVLPFSMLYAGGTQTPATLPFCDCQVLLDRSYYAPLWDRSWPDDTVLEFDYMDQAAADSGLAPGYRSKEQLRAALGPASALHFDSGYEVWRYVYPAATTTAINRNMATPPDQAHAEFLVLFGQDGIARKSRTREPQP